MAVHANRFSSCVYLLFGLCTLVFFSQCNHADSRTIYYKKGKFLIKETRDKAGNLIETQSFTKDTIADREKIEYYANGRVKKWSWYNKMSKIHHPDSVATIDENKNIDLNKSTDTSKDFPDCIVYYKVDGSVDTFVGRPFIATGFNKEHNLCIAVINPPNVNATIGYGDFNDNKKIKEFDYSPVQLTDSVSWFILFDYHPQKGHKYMLYYYMVDSLNHILFETSTGLQNDADEQ